jgi:thymidylate synthase (FAD)
MGVCREQARIVLPVATYSECIWTASTQSIMHFLRLRLDENAQFEIREYAQAIYDITLGIFPKTMELIQCTAFDANQK